MIDQLGYRTPTHQLFWGLDETNVGGTLGVLINGVAATETVLLAAGTDYTGKILVPVPAISYTWQLTLDGTVTTAVRNARAYPTASKLTIGIWGDANRSNAGFARMTNEQSDVNICLGDWDYIDTDIVDNTNVQEYRDLHREELLSGISRRQLLRDAPQLIMWDNHDAIGFSGLAKPDTAFYDAGLQATSEYYLGLNPTNTDAGIHTDIIFNSYSVPYHQHYINSTHIIMLDQISWMVDTGNIAGNPRMDETQMAWFEAAIAGSTGDVILVMSPAQPKYIAINNTWWDRIFEAIDASPKTVVLITADSHGMSVVDRLVGCAGFTDSSNHPTWFPNRGLVEVQATPIAHTSMTVGDAVTGNNLLKVHHYLDNTNGTFTSLDDNFNYLTIDIDTSKVTINVKSAYSGTLRWQGTIPIGSRTITETFNDGGSVPII